MVKKIQPRISCPFRLSTYIDCPNIGIICILFFSPITRSFLLQYTQIYMKSEAGGPCALLFFVKNCQSFVMWLSGQRGVRWASGQGEVGVRTERGEVGIRTGVRWARGQRGGEVGIGIEG